MARVDLPAAAAALREVGAAIGETHARFEHDVARLMEESGLAEHVVRRVLGESAERAS